MARPRVFISSTFYDLKYVRSSLDSFIEGLGYEVVLSEKGRIAYDPDLPLDESCYRDAADVDIFVLIVGGRYGSAASGEKLQGKPAFYDRYESITKMEYRAAVGKDIPSYILAEKNVFTEYETFRKNKGNTTIDYAHVDSVNIFRLLEEILSQSHNNPVYQFERHTEIEAWLKEQWAGLFRELINRRSEQKQLATLADKVAELSSINSSLQRYMEAVVSRVSASPEEAKKLITSEKNRLDAEKVRRGVETNIFVRDVLRAAEHASSDDIADIVRKASSLENVAVGISKLLREKKPDRLIEHWRRFVTAVNSINELRILLGLVPLDFSSTKPKKD